MLDFASDSVEVDDWCGIFVMSSLLDILSGNDRVRQPLENCRMFKFDFICDLKAIDQEALSTGSRQLNAVKYL